MKIIIKRDGRVKDYSFDRIHNAIIKAYKDVYKEEFENTNNTYDFEIAKIEKNIEDEINKIQDNEIDIEDIQNIVVSNIHKVNHKVALAYEEYRNKRERARLSNNYLKLKEEIFDKHSDANSNANVDENSFGGKELRLLEEIEKIAGLKMLPSDIALLSKKGILKQHDLSKLALGMHNCLLIDYVPQLENGFSTRQGDTKPATAYLSACQLIPVIIQTQSLEQFGGCGLMNFSVYMVKWLKKSIAKRVSDVVNVLDLNVEIPKELKFSEAKEILGDKYLKAKRLLDNEVKQAHQALITNLVTLQSRSGSQLPFSSLNLGLIDKENEEESVYIIEMFLNELHRGIGKKDRTAIFPITCFQVKNGLNRKPEDKYFYLRMLAQKVCHKRLYPTIVNCDWTGNKATNIREEMNMMGCRTMTGFNIFKQNYDKTGRGNNVPVTINLPYLALMVGGDVDRFFDELDLILKQARRSLLIRYDIMKNQRPSSAQFMYKNKTIMDADKCKDTVEEALKNNSLAIGYIGVAECCKALTGYYHCEDDKAQELGVSIVKKIRDYCDLYTKEDNLNYVTYASPSEGYCEEALQSIRRDFGIIKGISDREYLTNSHHCPVHCGVDAFKKAKIEGAYAEFANGGNIYHIEVDGVNYNEKAVTKAIDAALDNDIPYIRISHPIATCMNCSHTTGRFMDTCEVCGSDNVENLAIVTGYLTTDKKYMNKGKQDEVAKRELNIYE